jgi:hypothetical protein
MARRTQFTASLVSATALGVAFAAAPLLHGGIARAQNSSTTANATQDQGSTTLTQQQAVAELNAVIAAIPPGTSAAKAQVLIARAAQKAMKGMDGATAAAVMAAVADATPGGSPAAQGVAAVTQAIMAVNSSSGALLVSGVNNNDSTQTGDNSSGTQSTVSSSDANKKAVADALQVLVTGATAGAAFVQISQVYIPLASPCPVGGAYCT